MSDSAYYPEGGWTPLLESAAREVFEVMLNSKLEPFQDDPSLVTEMIAMVGLSGRGCPAGGIWPLRSIRTTFSSTGAPPPGCCRSTASSRTPPF